jgi:DNA-binding NarL/FixJ family response regulator
VRRVLIGDFGSIIRIGLRELLVSSEIELVADAEQPASGIIGRLTEARPDVVILDLDNPDTPTTAQRISTTFPAIKVITCSPDEPVMRVFPAFHHGESYQASLTLSSLAAAIQS